MKQLFESEMQAREAVATELKSNKLMLQAAGKEKEAVEAMANENKSELERLKSALEAERAAKDTLQKELQAKLFEEIRASVREELVKHADASEGFSRKSSYVNPSVHKEVSIPVEPKSI